MAVQFGKGLSKNQSVSRQINNRLVPPKGWFTAEELETNYNANGSNQTKEVEEFIEIHLPMAAKRAERLIDALRTKFNIEVPESYLRVRADVAFQVLLLISQADFVAPKIAAARLLAEEFARTETYDMCFTFSVLSESVVNNVVLPNDYRLKHLNEEVELARVHIH